MAKATKKDSRSQSTKNLNNDGTGYIGWANPGKCCRRADVPRRPHSLIRFDVCGHDAPIGLSESYDVNFGANSDWSVLLLNLGAIRYDNRPLRDHPNSEKLTNRQLLNDSFKVDFRWFIFGETR
jgi:hypothetical protein